MAAMRNLLLVATLIALAAHAGLAQNKPPTAADVMARLKADNDKESETKIPEDMKPVIGAGLRTIHDQIGDYQLLRADLLRFKKHGDYEYGVDLQVTPGFGKTPRTYTFWSDPKTRVSRGIPETVANITSYAARRLKEISVE